MKAAQAKFKELRDSAVAAAAAGKEKAAEQERGKLADLSHDKKIAAYGAVKKMKEKDISVWRLLDSISSSLRTASSLQY